MVVIANEEEEQEEQEQEQEEYSDSISQGGSLPTR